MPKKNLTDAGIKNMKRPDTVVDYWDTTTRGLGLRIAPSGRRTFNVQAKVLRNGKRRDTRFKLGVYPVMTLAEAREQAVEIKRQLKDGLDPVAVRKAEASKQDRLSAHHVETSFSAIRQRFLNEYVAKNLKASTSRDYRQVLTVRFGLWDDIAMENIDGDMVLDVLETIDRPYAANHARAYLSGMCSWAVKKRIILTNPVRDIAKPHKETARDRVLEDDEIADLWIASDEMGYPFGLMFKVLLLTGQRIGEVSGMRRADVDLDKQMWTIPGSLTKNKERHSVPLSDQVVAILIALPRISDQYMFSTTTTTPISGFGRAKNQIDNLSNVTEWRWHDLRRTFATNAAEHLEIDLPVAEAIMNHKSGSTAGIVGVYNRARYTEQKKTGLQAWANWLDRLTGQVDTSNVVSL